ncbi:MAG: NF038122 family metalloprotease, partial [Cyanobacteria bacterium P01_D01_bin.105]
ETQAEGFTILDLFRHSDESGAIDNPDGAVSDLTRGQNSYFSVDGGETNLGNFSNGIDYQASHWERLRVAMGIMDPTLAYQERTSLGLLDLQAFDALGWDVNYAALNQSLDLDTLLTQAEQAVAIDLGLASARLTENRTGEESSIAYDLGYGELWKLFEQSLLNLGYGELWHAFELGYGELWQTYGKDIFNLGYGELWQLVEENIFKLGYGELWQQFETEMFELGYGELWQQFETEMLNLGYGELWQTFEQSMLALGYGELWQAFELGYGELWQQFGSDLFKLGYGELWQLVEQNVFELGYGELWQQFEDEMFELGYGELWQQFETEMLQLGYGELWQQLGTFYATLDESGSNPVGQILADGGVGGRETKIFYGGENDDVIAGDDKQDRIKAGEGDDLIDGKGGHDVIWGEAGRDMIYGQDGNDLIYGGGDDDLLLGETGNDELYGEAGNDIVSGGRGNDIVSGGDGKDDLKGDAGQDVLSGDSGNDRLDGGDDNDIVIGGEGQDEVKGGSGNDILYGDGAAGFNTETLKELRRQLLEEPSENTPQQETGGTTSSFQGPIRVEAEDMTLAGDYEIRTNWKNDSGDTLRVFSSATANTTFTGSSGNYLVIARYFDEANASATMDFSLNGLSLNQFILDQDTDQYYTQSIAQNLYLNSGDVLTTTITTNSDENGNLDYIEFVNLDSLIITELDTSTDANHIADTHSDTIRVEAESMTLVGDYSAASYSFASGGSLIQLSNQGQGKALTAFSGETGFYNIIVGYYDEMGDGVGSLSASLDGSELDSWQLDQNLDSASVTANNFVTRTVASGAALSTGDVFALTGLRGDGYEEDELTSIDYVEFVRVEAPTTIEASISGEPVHLPTHPMRVEVEDIRLEVEDMRLSGDVRFEDQSFASGGQMVKTKSSFTAEANFSGPTGLYNIIIGYYDESDGQSPVSVSLDGRVLDSWTLDQNLGHGAASTTNFVTRTVATAVTLTEGNLLEIQASKQSGEYGRIDYIEFVAVEPSTEHTVEQHTVELSAEHTNANSDVLQGGAGDDIAIGGADNDMIDGGAGNDILYGDFGPGGQLIGPGGQLIGSSSTPTTLTFQQGVNGYAGISDNYIYASSASADTGASGNIRVDTNHHGAPAQGLLRFDNLFGDQAGQIGASDTISSAILELNAMDAGDSVELYNLLQNWKESSSTWNFWGNGIQTNGVEAANTSVATTGAVSQGTLRIDVTASLQAWQADPDSNFGWAFLATGSDDVRFDSSEGTIAPKLIVDVNQGATVITTDTGSASETQVVADTEDISFYNASVVSGSTAIDFDGVGDYGKLAGVETGGGMTFSAWVNYDSFNNWSRIFDFGNGASNNNIYLTNRQTSNDLVFRIHNGSSVAGELRINNFWEANTWNHVTATIDDAGTMRVYKNGVLAGKSVASVVPETEIRSHNYIGKSNWAQDGDFDGQMDLIELRNTALSESEVQALYTDAVAYQQTGETSSSTSIEADSNGTAGNDVMVGGIGNDMLYGEAGDDILNGTSSAAGGISERDIMTGGNGADTFILGDSNRAYYLGEGLQDYALIKDFATAEGDRLQLHGSTGSYTQQQQGSDLYLYYQGTTSDLVAIFENSTTLDLNAAVVNNA